MRNRLKSIRTGRATRGSMSVEALATMLLLLLLGIGVFSLAITSTSAYERILSSRSSQSEVRVALSFIEMKLRQNDLEGAVRIENNPVNGEPSLVITEQYGEEFYETWIYRDGGKLREALMSEGEAPYNDASFEIADLDGFKIGMNGRSVDISVWIGKDGKRIGLESVITLRSQL